MHIQSIHSTSVAALEVSMLPGPADGHRVCTQHNTRQLLPHLRAHCPEPDIVLCDDTDLSQLGLGALADRINVGARHRRWRAIRVLPALSACPSSLRRSKGLLQAPRCVALYLCHRERLLRWLQPPPHVLRGWHDVLHELAPKHDRRHKVHELDKLQRALVLDGDAEVVDSMLKILENHALASTQLRTRRRVGRVATVFSATLPEET